MRPKNSSAIGICVGVVVVVAIVFFALGSSRSAGATPSTAADLAAKVQVLQLQVAWLTQRTHAIEGPGSPSGHQWVWNLQDLTRTVQLHEKRLDSICSYRQVVVGVQQPSLTTPIVVRSVSC